MREILVQQDGKKEFKITVPDEAKITFGPFSPPNSADGQTYRNSMKAVGTLRVYLGSKENIIGVWTGVESFRDISNIEYSEKVAVEEGAKIWKSDKNGYEREEKTSVKYDWVGDSPSLLEAPEDDTVFDQKPRTRTTR